MKWSDVRIRHVQAPMSRAAVAKLDNPSARTASVGEHCVLGAAIVIFYNQVDLLT